MHHFLQFFCFVAKIFVSLFAATCLGNTLFMGTKKDKRYACLLYLVARFRTLSNSSLRTNNEYMYISIFSFHCLSLFV